MKITINIFFLFCMIGLLNRLGAEQQELILFLQETDQHFAENALPKIRSYAAEKNLKLIERQVEEGVPSTITTTPAIVFQNSRGRSIYSSRYAEWNTLLNFIRTSRVVAQKSATLAMNELFVQQLERARVGVPLKITKAKGALPKSFNEYAFREELKRGLTASLGQFKYVQRVELNRTDRLFYLDLHPYFNKNGTLSMSVEIYSQYSSGKINRKEAEEEAWCLGRPFLKTKEAEEAVW